MPWNDQSGGGDNRGQGPWGGGPRQPWGQGPKGPQQGQGGPDLEDMLRRARERFGRFGNGGNGGRSGGAPRQINFGAIAGVVVALWLATGIYVVDEGERGVVTTFGAYNGNTTSSGLHWHLPLPIESVRVISVTKQNRIAIGAPDGQETAPESLMITGDRNIVDIEFAVLYRLKDAPAFLFNVADPEDAVRGLAESSMREIIGQRELEAIITTERASVEQAVSAQLQQVLDSYDSGVEILGIQLLKAA
ncbi:MAG: protease modulator HflK, partial [Caulobacterales bacterium]